MKKLTLLLILMVLSINVWAEWTAVTKSSDNNITSYVDLQSIRKKGSKVKIWDLTDLKTAQAFNNVSYLSSVSHYEYDCSEETQQLLDFYAYSENMGLGETVNVQNNIKDEATTIKPGSIGETTFNVACSKKTKEKVVNNTQKYVWSLLYKADDINSYFDKSTIKRNGNVVTFATMLDMNELQSGKNGTYYSYITKTEVNCGNLTYRNFNAEVKSAHMGEGKTIEIIGVPENNSGTSFPKENILYKQFCTN